MPEIKVQMSIILKFKYYGTPCNVKTIQTGDNLEYHSFAERCNIRLIYKLLPQKDQGSLLAFPQP